MNYAFTLLACLSYYLISYENVVTNYLCVLAYTLEMKYPCYIYR